MGDRILGMERLSRRERNILHHLAEDRSNQEIAALENLALSSVKWYVQQIFAKLGVNKRGEAVVEAQKLGLLPSFHVTHPQVASEPWQRHNLPAQLSAFVGREKEIVELLRLLEKAETRLLTLSGPGGTGKTRLAIQAASVLLEAFPHVFPDGVWLVELAYLSEPLLVPLTVLAALGQVEQHGKQPLEQVSGYLRGKRMLLILDNCEHMIEACVETAFTLLQSVRGLTILATSREILGVGGEIIYHVPPLRVPGPRTHQSLEELGRCEAVQFFVQRAKSALPQFTLQVDNAAAIVTIVRRLDGIPLALELAAARLRLLTPQQIVERLDDAFHLLTHGARSSLPRHQTLTALIDWSYSLLSESEQSGLQTLSVFKGGWTLEAAEAVCADQHDILDLLGQLTDKSLVIADPDMVGGVRFHMLDMVTRFARERLLSAGENETVHQRHLQYYLSVVESLDIELRGKDQIVLLNRLEKELDNLRQALAWGLKHDAAAELRLTCGLRWFWHIRCHWSEGIAWLERGLAALGSAAGDGEAAVGHSETRAWALSVLGFHVMMRDIPNPANALPLLEEALAVYLMDGRRHLDRLPWTLTWLAQSSIGAGELSQASHWAGEALSLFRERGDMAGIANSLHVLGECEIEPERQKELFHRQLEICKTSGDMEAVATALNDIASTGFFDGDYQAASVAYADSRELFLQVGNPNMAARNGLMLAIVTHLAGDADLALERLDAALVDSRGIANEIQTVYCLFWKCVVASATGEEDPGVKSLAEAQAIAERVADPLLLADVYYHHARMARLRRDFDLARKSIQNGMDLRQSVGVPCLLEWLELGRLELMAGDLDQAGKFLREGMQTVDRWRQGFWSGPFLDALALLAARADRLERAARLFGTPHARGWFHTLSPGERLEREAVLAHLRAALGAERFAHLRAEGRGMSFVQVLALALE